MDSELKTPRPEFHPPLAADAVLANEDGRVSLYLRPDQRMSGRQQKTVVEMLCGWCASRNRDGPTRLMQVNAENWERAIGLVVCGLAERIQL